MDFYSVMANHYDELFPLASASVPYIISHMPAGTPPAEKKQRESATCALPALNEHDTDPPVLLDAGCAAGSLSIALAHLGYRVIGVDANEDMIAKAREKSEEEELTHLTEFHAADILGISQIAENLNAAGRLSGILCFGNTLPHLLSRKDRISFLHQASRILMPDGVILLQILNYDKILKDRPGYLPVIETERFIFTRAYRYGNADGTINFSVRLRSKESGESAGGNLTLRPVTRNMLKEELAAAGFGKTELYEDYARSPYDSSRSDMLLCAGHAGT